MAEEGAAKLRLKPRKAPAACSREPGPGQEPPGRRQTLTDRCSWFEKDDFNECENPWILLLKGISQDVHCTSWQTLPSFPEFSGKLRFDVAIEVLSFEDTVCLSQSSKEECLQREVFTIGTEDFEWVSFPSFCKEKCLSPEDLGSHQLPPQSQGDQLDTGQGQADGMQSLPSTAEKIHCVTTTDPARRMVGEDTKGISEQNARSESCKLPEQSSSTHRLALSQSSAKAFSFQQHCRGTAHNSRENRTENYRKELQVQTHQGKISFGEASRCVSAEENPPLGSTPGNESCKEMENQSEGSSTLDSCPMCQIHFSATLSQLDIDGHLARCLSESADDVMW